MEKRITLETTLFEIARLRASIAIAEYAKEHIQTKIQNGDTENLEAALERCREIVDRLAKQEEMEHEKHLHKPGEEVKDACDIQS